MKLSTEPYSFEHSDALASSQLVSHKRASSQEFARKSLLTQDFLHKNSLTSRMNFVYELKLAAIATFGGEKLLINSVKKREIQIVQGLAGLLDVWA